MVKIKKAQEDKEVKEEKEIKEVVEKKEKWQEKAEEYLNGWKRCQADFENYKKRQVEERKDLIHFGNVRLISEILPVIDNFHASTDHIPKDQKDNAWVTGIMYIQRQLEQMLSDNGVTEIEVKAGDEFDPEIHEAIKQESGNSEQEVEGSKNIIKKVVQKGYKIGERVIRAARVIVE